jgi:opacity protein-like surface antigen
MKRKLLTLASVAALTTVLSAGITSAQAADFSYNFVEGSLQDIDINGTDSEAATFSGSFDIAPNLNIIAGYRAEQISTPAGFSDIDADTLTLGLGYHAPVGDNTDLTASLSAISKDMDYVGDDTGFGVGVGIRHQINDAIEIGAKVDYVDIYDADDTTLEINSRFAVSDNVSLGLAYSTSQEEVDTLSAGVRFEF